MVNHLISTSISTNELTFKPGGLPAVFEVNAINDSDRFASFQLEVQAASADAKLNQPWYLLNSEVSTKNHQEIRADLLLKLLIAHCQVL